MESVGWNSAHYQEPFHARRAAKLPSKLSKLGVLDLPRDARILDTCCGKGEALRVLRRAGFTRLTGADGQRHTEWTRIPSAQFATCDVRSLPFPDGHFDAITNLHALHHLGDGRGVADFVEECLRVLRPGGRLFVLDFPGSPQIRLLFWAMRHRLGLITPGLRNFAEIVDEEWGYLKPYLADWVSVRDALDHAPAQESRWNHEVFLYYLTLMKARHV